MEYRTTERGTLSMFLNELNIDVQIYQEEVKKPNTSSVVLVPVQNNSEKTNQLLLKWSDKEGQLTQKDIDEASQVVFQEWERVFPLYKIERAFVDISSRGAIEIYVTFDATNVFSNTQIRNIKKTISELLEKEIKNVSEKSFEKMDEVVTIRSENNHINNQVSLAQQKLSDAEKNHRRVELELRERFNSLKQENSNLQMSLQQSKADELNQKETIGHLTLQIERQQRTLNELSDGKTSREVESEERYRHLQEQLDDLNYKLRQTSQELLEKQREVQQLQTIVSDNERYVASLQADYNQLRESNNSQVEQLLQENDVLKSDLVTYQNNELNGKKEVQLVKNELRQISLEKENLQEELQQKLQRIEYENNELRIVLQENQVFEDKTQQELVQTTRDLNETHEKIEQLETENSLLTHEWESRYQNLSLEKEDLIAAYNTSRQLEMERQNELIQLKNRLITLEQGLQQAGLEQQRVVARWESRVADEEREKNRIIQQADVEKEQLTKSKEQEIKRLSERLEQQRELVDKLMATNTETQTSWQENYELLETNYRSAREKSNQLEQEITRLVQENKYLEQRLSSGEVKNTEVTPNPIISNPIIEDVAESTLEAIIQEPILASTSIDEVVENKEEEAVASEVKDVSYEEDYDYDYSYDEDESSYDYSEYYYEEEYDYDYDYAYSEVDDLVSYDAETIREDIEELLDSSDEEGTEKISKKDYAIYEDHLDKLKRRLEKTEDVEFKAFVTPKMKKFTKFKNKFDEEVVSPKFFSRKYKIEENLFNQLKAYVLMSRHLEVLAGDNDEEDYGYEDDYDYGYEYEYE